MPAFADSNPEVLEPTEGERVAPRETGASIDSLEPGMTGVVGSPRQLTPVVLRLMEMGLTPGTEITVTRRALGADPIEIRLRGTRLCVRRADAALFPIT